MKVQIHRSAQDLASSVAQHIAAAIARKPNLAMALPAGRTPIGAYRKLVAASRTHTLDWSAVRTFNLDEFVTPGGEALQPFQRFMQEHLLALINVSPGHVDFPNGRAANLEAEADRYERAIADAGGLDLALLGIGANGHIGFNEPAPALVPRTHLVTLSPESRQANAWLFGDDLNRVPNTALSMGMATIFGARSVVLLAMGVEKAAAVSAMVNGEITTARPASLLQLHRHATVLVDEAAASHLGQSSGAGGAA